MDSYDPRRGDRVPLVLALFFLVVMVGGSVDLWLDRPDRLLTPHVLFEVGMILVSLGAAGWLGTGWLRTQRRLVATDDERSRLAEERRRWEERARRPLIELGEEMSRQFEDWGLTPTERRIALMLLQGLSHKRMAHTTGTSERTVRQHSVAIYRKSGLAGRAELAGFFLEAILLPEDRLGAEPDPSSAGIESSAQPDPVRRAPHALLTLTLAATVLAASACGGPGAGDADASSTTLGAAAAAAASTDLPARFVDADWLRANADAPDVVILAVGTDRSSFEAGHLPGARWVPFSDLVVTADGVPNELPPLAELDSTFEALGISDGSRVIVDGAPLQAARTLLALTAVGLGERSGILLGGTTGWVAAGGTLSTDEAPASRGDLTPVPPAALVVDADWIAARLDDPSIALVDARPPEQYSGEVPGSGIERGGHLPGAVSLFWEEMTTSTAPLELREVGELRALFEAAGVEPGDTVVAYCRTGVQASMTWAVATLLGYETRIYDASYADWSARGDLPVAR